MLWLRPDVIAMSRVRARKTLRVFPAVVILELLQRRLIEDATPRLSQPVGAVPTVVLIATTENEKDVHMLGKIMCLSAYP